MSSILVYHPFVARWLPYDVFQFSFPWPRTLNNSLSSPLHYKTHNPQHGYQILIQNSPSTQSLHHHSIRVTKNHTWLKLSHHLVLRHPTPNYIHLSPLNDPNELSSSPQPIILYSFYPLSPANMAFTETILSPRQELLYELRESPYARDQRASWKYRSSSWYDQYTDNLKTKMCDECDE